MQMAVILAFCRAVGWAARFVGQPQVVAEMIAGFLIGPSVFGWLVPDVQRVLFPAESLHSLYVCSHVGLALYMFVVGLGLQALLFVGAAMSITLVLMTIATTLMAYPLFGVVYRRVNALGRIPRVDAPLTHPSP